jgi:hypothetical protein
LSVGSYDPSATALSLSPSVVAELLSAARQLDEPNFGLAEQRVVELAPLARQGDRSDWRVMATSLDEAELENLIRLFTLAEHLPGWSAQAQSPVIPLARELKARDRYPEVLTGWIKSHTDNRFLPYGSLMDRL